MLHMYSMVYMIMTLESLYQRDIKKLKGIWKELFFLF